MAQFDVYENTGSNSDSIPYLIDVQHDLLDLLATRVVVPLFRANAFPRPARTLNPVFEVDGARVVMSTAELAGVRSDVLGRRVGSLADHRAEIVRAIDVLLSGV